ncbi:MAG: hypothetical protein PVS3B1_17850 [Ktedonobacteraceae bacterium]
MTQRPDAYHMEAGTNESPTSPPPLTEQEHLGALSLEISIALSGFETLDEMLKACTEALLRHTDAALARIWLPTEDNTLELHASAGPAQPDNASKRVPLSSTTGVAVNETAYTAIQRKPHLVSLLTDDANGGNHSKSPIQQWARQENITAFAGYPLLVRAQLIGVLELFTCRPLSVVASQTLSTVSNSIALGIERQRMLEERTYLLQREHKSHIEAEIARQHLHDLFMQAPAIICVLHGPQHTYELANPLYLQIIGQQDIIGKTVHETSPELGAQGYYDLLDRVYTTGEPFIGKELPAKLDRDGRFEDAYFNFVYQPTHDDEGKVDGILIHAVDVTEQVKAREALKNNQERLELAQQSGHIGTFELVLATGETIWTPELEAVYGLPPGGFEGKYENWANRVHPDDLPAVEENLRSAIAGGPPFDIEYRILWPNGAIRWIQAKGIVDCDEQGKPTRVIGVNIDITERTEAERELSRLYQSLQDLNANLEAQVIQRTEALNQINLELQRSNNELQDFAYVASHDLQEPLRKIQAFGNLLEEEYGDVVGEGKMYIERMRSAAARMRVLIDDLLAFSRVTTKAQPFVQVDLNAVAQQVVDDLGPRLEAAHGTIELGELPTIEADPQQMYQMLQNLMGNAVKFHKPDSPPVVKVSAELLPASVEPDAESKASYLLRVEDNGIGFDEKYTDRIFTVFQRLHGKDSYEGTGIGLAVVRKIVERHNGTIIAHSSPGNGATFLVTLPIQHGMREIEA